MVRKALIAFSIMTVVAVTLLFVYCKPTKDVSDPGAESLDSTPAPEVATVPEPLSEAEVLNCFLVAEQMVGAYTNRQHEALVQMFSEISNAVPRLGRALSDKAFAHLRQQATDDLTQSRFELQDFPTVPAFDAYMRVNMDAIELLDRIYVWNGMYDGSLREGDMLIYKHFEDYRLKFEKEGAKGFEEAAEAGLRKWKWHIMNEQCYVRAYYKNLFTMLQRWPRSKLALQGIRSTNDLVRSIRKAVNGFYQFYFGGGEPKWLDEEFPLQPEVESKEDGR